MSANLLIYSLQSFIKAAFIGGSISR